MAAISNQTRQQKRANHEISDSDIAAGAVIPIYFQPCTVYTITMSPSISEAPLPTDQADQLSTSNPTHIQLPADEITVMEAFTALVAKVDPETESKHVLSQIQRLASRLSQSLSEAVSMHEVNSVDRKVARLRFAKGLETSIDQADQKLHLARRQLVEYRLQEDKAQPVVAGGELDLSKEDPVEKALGDAIMNVGAARNAITPDHPACAYDAGFRFIQDN